MLTTGVGVKFYYFSSNMNVFNFYNEKVSIPKTSRELAINMANYHYWPPPVRAFIDESIDPSDPLFGTKHTLRWIGSLVGEAEQILTLGGAFLYPSDSRVGYEEGQLRIVCQCAAIAFLVEHAGGKAIDGIQSIIKKTSTYLYARRPFMFGSSKNVDQIIAYYDKAYPNTSALFGDRGLFQEN